MKSNQQLKEDVLSLIPLMKGKIEANENKKTKRKLIGKSDVKEYIFERIWGKIEINNPTINSHVENISDKKHRNNIVISSLQIIGLFMIIFFFQIKTINIEGLSDGMVFKKLIIDPLFTTLIISIVLFFILNSTFLNINFMRIEGCEIFKKQIKEKYIKEIMRNTNFNDFINMYLCSPDIPADEKYLKNIINKIHKKDEKNPYLAEISDEITKNNYISYLKLDLFYYNATYDFKLSNENKNIINIKLASLSDEDFVLEEFRNDLVSKIIS